MNGDLGDQPKSLLLCRKLVIRKEVLNMAKPEIPLALDNG